MEVHDNGIGFEPSAAGKLFRAFEQGGRNITRQYGGLGLGLAITHSIIEAHGGTIRASSPGQGKGATFSFEIPLHAQAENMDKQLLSAASSQAQITTKNILLVEDHKDSRISLENLLIRAHHHVVSAGSAKEALQLAASHHFDLVISDIGLPDQSGLELMQKLKDEFALKGIALSGYGMDEDISKGKNAGFEHYLTKPVRFAKLKQIILEVETSSERVCN